MAEAIQDPIQDPIQGPIAAVDRQDGRFSFGEIHEYVVRAFTLKVLYQGKQAGSQEEVQVLSILL